MGDEVTRRGFVAGAMMSVAGAAAGQASGVLQQAPAGTPPAFGTAPAVGPAVTVGTFAEAEKLVQVEMTAKDRAQAAESWGSAMAPLLERRVGPKKVVIPEGVAPWSGHALGLSVQVPAPAREGTDSAISGRPGESAGDLPGSDAEIAFAPVWKLAAWVRARKITSERLTKIYLERMSRYDGELKCVITAMPESALKQGRLADAEIAGGRYRGALHGIPWGGKDLLDTAGVKTTYGAEVFRERVPLKDAAVVSLLSEAGAVMVAKLSMGALALNDVWFGGQTKNPWLLEEGSGGSSAGPGSATAAGLVGFAIGSETEGSIVGPTMRCGITGLRPTFGRVPRTGAMTLCWSLDKLGPMTRSVEDTMLVLKAIARKDAGDLATSEQSGVLDVDWATPVKGLRVGYFPGWMKEATEVDRHALGVVEKLGMTGVPVSLPDWPYGSLNVLLFAEAAAAFEEITLDHRVEELKAQVADAWPNSFRSARFLSAVDYVQTDRFRRMVAGEMARLLGEVDLLLVPGLRDEMLTISNFTGHPSLTLRAGFLEVTETRSDWAPGGPWSSRKLAQPRRVPHGVTLVGRLWDESTIARVGWAMEREFGVAEEKPKGFGV